MADTKISQMTAAAPLTGAELVPLVQSGANVQAAVSSLQTYLGSKYGSYGNLYITGGVTGQSMNATPTKLTCWTTSGPSNNMTLSTVNNQITVLNTGIYQVIVNLNFAAGNNTNYNFRVYNNTSATSYANTLINTHIVGTDHQEYSIQALISANANDVLYVQSYTDGATDTITMQNANFILVQIG